MVPGAPIPSSLGAVLPHPGEEVLFHGTQLPIHTHLERLLQELFARQEK